MHLYLIVLYNQNVFYSSTWISLVKLLESHPHTAKVYIWDNSPSAQHCKGDFDDLNGFEEVVYQHSQNNEKLSIIYNSVIDKAFQECFECVTILDQDSILPLDFKCVLNAVNNNLLSIPTVYSNKNGLIISPRYQKYDYFTNKCQIEYKQFDKNDVLISSVDFFAVGSGMTISRSVWNSGVRFVEELSFYGVDTEFCIDYAKKYDVLNILHCNFIHDASGESIEDKTISKWRLTKYFEHWEYQLKNYVRLPSLVAKIYVMFRLEISLIKKEIKKLYLKFNFYIKFT